MARQTDGQAGGKIDKATNRKVIHKSKYMTRGKIFFLYGPMVAKDSDDRQFPRFFDINS